MFQVHQSVPSPRYTINSRNRQVSTENSTPRDSNVEIDFATAQRLVADSYEDTNYTYSRTGESSGENTERMVRNRNSRGSSQLTAQTSPSISLNYGQNKRSDTSQKILNDWSDTRLNTTIDHQTDSNTKAQMYDLDEIQEYDDSRRREADKLAIGNDFEFEPYEYLKVCDEMDNFYPGIQNQSFNAFSTEFQHKIRLLHIKLHKVEALFHGDPSEFTFAFRDFMGHFTTLIESADNWRWTVPFIMPFLKARAKKMVVFSSFQTNVFHAFRDVCFTIKNLCGLRAKHMQKVTLGTFWSILIQILAMNVPNQMLHVFETLQEIVLNVPPSLFLVDKLIRMRQNAGISTKDALATSMTPFRQYHYELILTFLSALDSHCEDHTMYRKMCMTQLKLWLDSESDPKLAQFVFTILRKYGQGIRVTLPAFQAHSMMQSDDESINAPVLTTLSPLNTGQTSSTLRAKDYYSRMDMNRRNMNYRSQLYGEPVHSSSCKIAKPWTSSPPVIATNTIPRKPSSQCRNTFRKYGMKHGSNMKKSFLEFYNGRIRHKLTKRFAEPADSD